jgi:hypothetical protein
LLSLVAGLASAGFALAAGVAAWFLLLPALALGLLHRRIKHIPFGKSVYITVCWLAVVVGLPVAIDAGVRDVGWVLAITASAVFANAVASNLRDIDVATAHFGSGPALGAARSCAMIGSALALVAPAAVRPLVAVPLATLLVLISFRRGERYGLVAVDGALLVGAMVAIIASQL